MTRYERLCEANVTGRDLFFKEKEIVGQFADKIWFALRKYLECPSLTLRLCQVDGDKANVSWSNSYGAFQISEDGFWKMRVLLILSGDSEEAGGSRRVPDMHYSMIFHFRRNGEVFAVKGAIKERSVDASDIDSLCEEIFAAVDGDPRSGRGATTPTRQFGFSQ